MLFSSYIAYHATIFTSLSGALVSCSLGMREVPGSNKGNDFKFKIKKKTVFLLKTK